MIFGLPRVTARPAPKSRHGGAGVGKGSASWAGARHIFQASSSR